VRIKNLDLLYIVMRFLHRTIDDYAAVEWQRNYNAIAATIQAEMMEIFKTKLSVPKDFN
jgi:hypothetical protein